MKTKISPTVVGAFVIGAFALLIVALLTFGGVNLFDKPQRFIVFFDESIHGLDLGSPVKLRGVRVGRVVALNVRYDDRSNRSVVAVVCELSKDVVTDNKGAVLDVSSRAELQTLVDRGLRARLQVLGLATGLLYVELDLFDPREYPVDPKQTDLRYVVVPYVPSAIVEFQASATEILSKLKRVDFEGITRGLAALVTDARKQLEGVDLKGLTEQWKKTGVQVETLASSPDFKQTFENVNAAVADVRAAVAKLDARIEPTSKELSDTLAEAKKTIEAFNATATAAQAFISTHSGLGLEVVETLEHLNEAADAVKRLADFLERNPNALITGRKRPQ
ncbi:MAG: MlaD family protein [Opitutaceae bacterium]|nr:MlaD family protein [Opitutaceae bacterium]